MAGALALASVTAVLKDLLENGLADRGVTAALGGDAVVSALPPDRVQSGPDDRVQLNLFLYLACPRTTLRMRGGTSPSPLALDLHYVLSAYGPQDLQAEILLGHAMQLLHASPSLDREQVRAVLTSLSSKRRTVPAPVAALATSDLADWIERLDVVPTFLGTEEVSRLWSAFQAKFRPSATYRVSTIPTVAD